MRNKGQVAVFVIVGVLLVAAIALFFLFRSGKIPSIVVGFEEDPQLFLESCIESKISKGADLLLKQGGNINPLLYKTFKFGEEGYQNISYLCYTSKNYVPCVNQEPVLIKHLEDEISTYIGEDLEECFSDWKTNMEKQNYKVNLGSLNYSVNLEPNQIIVEANRGISLNKKEESFQYEEFRVVIRNKLYDLSILSQEILSQEAEFCNFDHLGYMILYSDFDIDKFRTGDLDTIYTIIDKKSGDKMRFAIRGCVIPSGI
tara:strand:- start:2023 stop:2796 length:774 start_codon:yes stop_codon:yes gene_type:complete